MKCLLVFSTFLVHFISFSQIAIGKVDLHPHAKLEVWTREDEGKGVLLPRILLRDVKQAHPFDDTNDIMPESLLVYNTGSDGAVPAGYYYWYSDQWNKVLVAGDDFEVSFRSPWNKAGTTDMAERNDDHIYQEGRVGIGEPGMTPEAFLDVRRGDALIHGLTVGRGNGYRLTNTAVGSATLASNTAGVNNVAVGYEALYKNEGGDNNIAMGYQALYKNEGGGNNIAAGSQALYNNFGGTGNIAAGYQALYSNEGGTGNIASGYQALYSNKGGSHNIAAGQEALYTNETGTGNIAAGYQALYTNKGGSNNIAAGREALNKNEGGTGNIAAGYQALHENKGGNHNIAAGYQALHNNTSGQNNIAAGYQALYTNNIGYYNTAIGEKALYKNVSGIFNVAIGVQALEDNVGNLPSDYNAGGFNVAVGYVALSLNTTGKENTAIGHDSGPTSSGLNNTTAIGNGARVSTSNTIRLGNDNITHIYAKVSTLTASDRRWKENIKTIPLGLDFINKIRPVEYIRKNNESKTKEWGVIAQELQQTIADAGYQNAGIVDGDNTAENYLSVRYTDLMAPMIKAIQELSLQNEDLKRKNDQKVNQLENQINEMEKRIQRFMIK